MNVPIYVNALRFLGQNQLLFEAFITSAGLFTLAFEICYPFLVWKPRTRWLILSGAIFLHGGIGLFMGLKTFSLLMLIFNMAFLTTEEVRWLFTWLGGSSQPGEAAQRARQKPVELVAR